MPSLCCWWCSSFAPGLLRDVHQGSAGNPPKVPTVYCYLFKKGLLNLVCAGLERHFYLAFLVKGCLG